MLSVVIIVVMPSNYASLSSECEVKTNLLMAAVLAAFLLILQKLTAVHDAAALTDRLLTLMETRRANKEW